MSHNPYGKWAKIYRDRGLWPRPLKFPGTDVNTGKLLGKACREKGWQTPDPELPPATLERWDLECPQYNIGLLMGTPLGDGTCLGALDIDNDQYTKLGCALLNDPPCGRIGKKGAVFFVRVLPNVKKLKFRVKGEHNAHIGQVAECLFSKTLCVIPPSIHPETQQSYTWIGTPLHEMDFFKLPLIGE
jgi:hypothetical protein